MLQVISTAVQSSYNMPYVNYLMYTICISAYIFLILQIHKGIYFLMWQAYAYSAETSVIWRLIYWMPSWLIPCLYELYGTWKTSMLGYQRTETEINTNQWNTILLQGDNITIQDSISNCSMYCSALYLGLFRNVLMWTIPAIHLEMRLE